MVQFGAFADEMASIRRAAESADIAPSRDLLEQAERHARLLQQIWEMVERERGASREALQREERRSDPSWKSIGHHNGQFLAFDAVRSLLVGQQEAK